MPLIRSQLRNVYHFCDRCGYRRPLSEMKWQNGILVCRGTDCVDKAIVGSRDLNVARQLKQNKHELQVDQKLTHPADRRSDVLEPLY